MSDDMTILRQKQPAIAEFIDDWKKRYEGRQFDLTNEADQADFYEAMVEMSRHMAHVGGKATLSTIVNNEGVDTLYTKVAPRS